MPLGLIPETYPVALVPETSNVYPALEPLLAQFTVTAAEFIYTTSHEGNDA